jgi:hypothetical protein
MKRGHLLFGPVRSSGVAHAIPARTVTSSRTALDEGGGPGRPTFQRGALRFLRALMRVPRRVNAPPHSAQRRSASSLAARGQCVVSGGEHVSDSKRVNGEVSPGK